MAKIDLPQIQNGIIRTSAVDDTLAPQDTASFALNVNFDSIGAFEVRKGLTQVGSTLTSSKAVTGLHNYINNAGTNYKLLAMVNTTVKAYNGTSWSDVRTGLTADSRARFTSLVDYTFMVNGNANQACKSYAGAGSFGTTNVADLPAGDYIENFRSRIWVASSATDKLYYTDVVNTDNTITGGTSFIQISPQDGESITGLKRNKNALLVFKQNHIYRVYSINSADPDPKINRGTYSQESIVEAKDGIYYHHSSGFYKYTDSVQKEISLPIKDIVSAIPRAYYEKVSGWEDGDHIYWSVGDITLDGLSYTNLVVRYTISTEIWTKYSYSTELRVGGKYDNGTTEISVVGDDAGDVSQFNEGDGDNGDAIHYDLQTHWLYLTDPKYTLKESTGIGFLHENAEGATLSYRVDTDDFNKWTNIGQIEDSIFQERKMSASFKRIKLRVNGNTTGKPLNMKGFSFVNIK